MTRRTILSSIIMTCAVVALMLLAGNGIAIAQQDSNCCHYTVVVSPTIPNSCLPIHLATRWACNPVGTLIKDYSHPDVYIEQIGMPPFPPCPPACKLLGVSLDNVSFVGPGERRRVVIGDCCYDLDFGFGDAGCVVITITRCNG
jgi:hypothetical protein